MQYERIAVYLITAERQQIEELLWEVNVLESKPV